MEMMPGMNLGAFLSGGLVSFPIATLILYPFLQSLLAVASMLKDGYLDLVPVCKVWWNHLDGRRN